MYTSRCRRTVNEFIWIALTEKGLMKENDHLPGQDLLPGNSKSLPHARPVVHSSSRKLAEDAMIALAQPSRVNMNFSRC